MTDHTHTQPETPTSATEGTVATPVAAAPPTVVVEPSQVETRRFHVGSFVTGFITAVVVAALALVVFLVVSDSDDDGNIQIDVPAVNVDTGG